MRSATLKRVARYLADEDPALVRACLPYDTEEDQHEGCEGLPENFTVGCAVYWFCVDWHSGQSSPLYRASCAVNYEPGACESGPEEDSPDAMLYAELESIMEGRNR